VTEKKRPSARARGGAQKSALPPDPPGGVERGASGKAPSRAKRVAAKRSDPPPPPPAAKRPEPPPSPEPAGRETLPARKRVTPARRAAAAPSVAPVERPAPTARPAARRAKISEPVSIPVEPPSPPPITEPAAPVPVPIAEPPARPAPIEPPPPPAPIAEPPPPPAPTSAAEPPPPPAPIAEPPAPIEPPPPAPEEPPRVTAVEPVRTAPPAPDNGSSAVEAPVRAASPGGALLLTGICGRLGKLLARELHRTDRVIGIDRRPFPDKPKDIVHHQIDVRRKKTRDIFRSGDIRAVVHLGVLHDPRASDKMHHSWNVVAFQKLLDYLTQYDVPKLVVLSSANVYGPQPDNPQFLTEEAPLLGAQAFRGIRDLVELDMVAQSFFWRHPHTETVILRPCHILGQVRNAPSNYLRLERPLTMLGFDPMVQVVHERDVVRAIIMALRPGVRGIFNLKGPGELPLSRIFSMLGKKPMPVPSFMANAALDRMWRYRLTSFPPPELDHIRYVCMVDDSRARDQLGYHPKYSIEETLRAVVSER
jgi:UDP-glucose 4-epimerase